MPSSPNDKPAQQIGPSELQAAELEPLLSEDFSIAGYLSLLLKSKLRCHSSQFLRAHITRRAVRGKFM